VEGAAPPLRGVPPRNLKKGRVVNPCKLATSWTKNVGKPPANKGWEGGVRGDKAPMAGGLGGAPHKFKRGNEFSTLAIPPRVGPKPLANPKPTRAGKGGGGGGAPPRGSGGCALPT